MSKIAEMRTGEGKTLMATLAVYRNALSGKGVHVVTVNDYGPPRGTGRALYEFLGLLGGRGHALPGAGRKARRLCADTAPTAPTSSSFACVTTWRFLAWMRSSSVS